MPMLYLSPATYEKPAAAECHALEEQLLADLTDALEAQLRAEAISYSCRTVGTKEATAIASSNAERHKLHLALHCNMAPDSLSGALRGITVLHSGADEAGARAADTFLAELTIVYPLPSQVTAAQDDTAPQLAQVIAPALLLELGYEDSAEDAAWLQYRREEIAAALCRASVMFFESEAARPSAQIADVSTSAPFADGYAALPPLRTADAPSATVRAPGGSLVLRTTPERTSPIPAEVANNKKVAVLALTNEWVFLKHGKIEGYAPRNSILL